MRALALGFSLLSLLAPPLWGEEGLPYALTEPEGFSAGSVKGQSVYDNKARGSLDGEVMPEVRPEDTGPGLPAPHIVPYAKAPDDTDVLIGSVKRPAASSGEDRVFEQIKAEPGTPYLQAAEPLQD
ncbi:hypothetical protein [Marinobacterium sedimentorum]|uniref:hypothetical protein n=1 Tax=Marinobacterium sedimentorum TaxID=2927804 RepID=UPI0020C63D61|nr:hypothetical protein [Marinobacterium sedimentorum]MCP8689549.1 hypothetical protein [Marinobacterium sedimentorum]